jgi:hypothetical protein
MMPKFARLLKDAGWDWWEGDDPCSPDAHFNHGDVLENFAQRIEHDNLLKFAAAVEVVAHLLRVHERRDDRMSHKLALQMVQAEAMHPGPDSMVPAVMALLELMQSQSDSPQA